MATLHAASSDALTPSFLHDLRALLQTSFDGDFTDEDWDHTLGGVHVWVIGPDGLTSHASLVERTLVCSGQTLRVGYVEAVATVAKHRRNGFGTRVMTRIGELIRERYALGALSTGTRAFYEPLGWERWRGPTFVDGPRGRERTPGDDGDVMILGTSRSPHLDLDGEIVCDWRLGDVW
jgi:aminoglycoside 2'-N-acetyltransferase I